MIPTELSLDLSSYNQFRGHLYWGESHFIFRLHAVCSSSWAFVRYCNSWIANPCLIVSKRSKAVRTKKQSICRECSLLPLECTCTRGAPLSESHCLRGRLNLKIVLHPLWCHCYVGGTVPVHEYCFRMCHTIFFCGQLLYTFASYRKRKYYDSSRHHSDEYENQYFRGSDAT